MKAKRTARITLALLLLAFVPHAASAKGVRRLRVVGYSGPGFVAAV